MQGTHNYVIAPAKHKCLFFAWDMVTYFLSAAAYCSQILQRRNNTQMKKAKSVSEEVNANQKLH